MKHSVSSDETVGMPSVRALSRGLSILSEILCSVSPLGVNELARRTDLPKGTVSRLLRTLVETGYVSMTPVEGRYAVGRELVAHGSSSVLSPNVRLAIHDTMRKLRDASGETAAIYLPVWPDRVCVDQVESHSGLRRVHPPGEVRPMTTGAAGRVFLAYMTEAEVRRTVEARPLRKAGPNSITDLPQLFRTLELLRREGFATAISERRDGMSGLAAPLFKPGSTQPVGVLNLAGPETRFHLEAMRGLAPYFVQLVNELTHRWPALEGGAA